MLLRVARRPALLPREGCEPALKDIAWHLSLVCSFRGGVVSNQTDQTSRASLSAVAVPSSPKYPRDVLNIGRRGE